VSLSLQVLLSVNDQDVYTANLSIPNTG